MELSPIDIIKKIESTPPYQRDIVFKSYEGLEIKGIGKLCSVGEYSLYSHVYKDNRIKNGVYVHMNTYDENNYLLYISICCYLDLEKHPKLKIINDEKIFFSGKIKKVYWNYICIIDPIFTFEENEDNFLKKDKDTLQIDVKKKDHSNQTIHINDSQVNFNAGDNHTNVKNSNTTKAPSKWYRDLIIGTIVTVVGGLILYLLTGNS